MRQRENRYFVIIIWELSQKSLTAMNLCQMASAKSGRLVRLYDCTSDCTTVRRCYCIWLWILLPCVTITMVHSEHGARAAREPHGPRVRARACRLVGGGPRGTYHQTTKRACGCCCTRRAADNDANDAEGRVDRPAVRGRRGPPDRSPVIKKRKHAGSSERLTGDEFLTRGSADDVGRRRFCEVTLKLAS